MVLQASLVRTWEAARDSEFEEWDRENARHYDYAAKGKSAEKAVWTAMLTDEAYQGTDIVACTAQIDLVKAYEYVGLNLIWRAARMLRAPLDIVALSLQAFSAPRAIKVGGAFSVAVRTTNGLPAGSKFANRFLKIILFWPLDTMQRRWACAFLALYVDDITVRIMGTARFCAKTLPCIARWFIGVLEGPMRLKVSRDEGSEKGKSVTICSSAKCEQQVGEAMASLGIPLVRAVRWLGVDYEPLGRRRRATRAGRLKVAKRRWVKLAGLQRKRLKVRPAMAQGLRASLAYGSACEGVPPAISAFLTRRMAATRAGAGVFRSRALNAALQKSDDAAVYRLAPLRAWLKEAWDNGPGIRELMEKAWARQGDRLRQVEGGKAARWRKVRGPAGAAIMTAEDLGWQMPAPFHFSRPRPANTDENLQIPDMCPTEILKRAEKDGSRAALEEWTRADPVRAELAPRPLTSPAKQLIGKKRSDEWTAHHANVARSAFLGAFPEQAKLFAVGMVDSPMCVLCGKEEGTLRHLYWRCQADECRAARDPLTEPARKGSFRDLVQAGATGLTHELLWTRGLAANIAATPSLAIPVDEVRCAGLAGDDPYFLGLCATDGSFRADASGEIGHGGWAAVSGAGPTSKVIYGPLPLGQPSILAAEIFAVLQLLRHDSGIEEVAIDNLQVVKGLLRGKIFCTAAMTPFAHLWQMVWQKIDDIGLEVVAASTGGHQIVVTKVKAHRTTAEKAEMQASELARTALNELADEWAKAGADLQAPPLWRVKASDEGHAKA